MDSGSNDRATLQYEFAYGPESLRQYHTYKDGREFSSMIANQSHIHIQ